MDSDSTCSLWTSPGAAPGGVLGRVVAQGWHYSFLPGLAPGSITRGSGNPTRAGSVRTLPCPAEGAVDGTPVAPASRQHQSACPATAIARGWVCPAWQVSPSFWLGLFRRQQAPGGGGKPRLAYLDHIARGQAGRQEAPLKTQGQSPPSQLLEQSMVASPPCLLSLLFPECCPPPEWGGSTLCSQFWGQEASTDGT